VIEHHDETSEPAMADTPKPEPDSSAPNSPTEPTARKETTREIYAKAALRNPRMKKVRKFGQGFVIGGVKAGPGKAGG
jgi:hypothetical protein